MSTILFFNNDNEMEKEILLNQSINVINLAIIKKLNLIISLDIDETICVSNESKMKHKSIITAIWRTYYDDNRNKSIDWIENTFKETVNHLEELNKTKSSYKKLKLEEKYEVMISDLKNLLLRSIKGFQNLKITYQYDRHIIIRINEIVNKFHNYLHNL